LSGVTDERVASSELDATDPDSEHGTPPAAQRIGPSTAVSDAPATAAGAPPVSAEPTVEPGANPTAERAANPTAIPAAQPPAESSPDAAPAPLPETPPKPAAQEAPVPAEPARGPAPIQAEPTSESAAGPAEAPPVPAEPRTAGRFVADALHAAGVRVAFTVPGESFLGLLDVLGDAGIRVVAARHESAAAFMAEAYGQLTGRPGACLATRAVGAANLAIGIHTARADSTPLFAIVGQVPRAVRGREAFQEADLAASIGRLGVHAVEVDDVSRLPAAMAEATRHVLGGRPGPVLIALPEDLLDESMPAGASVVRAGRDRPLDPDPDTIRTVLRRLTAADRPLILAGAGVLRSRSSSDLVRLAEILEVPVMASWRRGDVFPNDHPLYLGMTGLGAPGTVRDRLAAADELLVVGSRLNEVASHGYSVPADGQRWTHVDLAPRTEVGGLSAPDLAIPSDARTFLRLTVRLLSGAVHDLDHLNARRAANMADRAAWEAATEVDGDAWGGPGVHPGRIVATLRRVLPPEAIVTTDAGNFAGWLARGYRWRRPGTFLGPTSGAMGYALPAGIAAALVHRDRPVVAVAGDGGFAMTVAELETAVRERLRVVTLVFDNERYGTIWMHQDQRGTGRGVATDLGPIDVAALAEAFGARGVRVDDDAAFEPALVEALGADRPTVIHLPLDRSWVSVDRRPS
jgi:acetolactate synthase-1/2/3 large subunit